MSHIRLLGNSGKLYTPSRGPLIVERIKVFTLSEEPRPLQLRVLMVPVFGDLSATSSDHLLCQVTFLVSHDEDVPKWACGYNRCPVIHGRPR